MVKADLGFTATYKGADGRTHTMDVVAWDDNGYALVLDGKRGQLVPAREYSSGFQD
jgi:hypothetical protein